MQWSGGSLLAFLLSFQKVPKNAWESTKMVCNYTGDTFESGELDTSNGMSIEFEEKETGMGRKKRYGHVDSAKLKFEVAKKVCGLRFEVSVAMGFRTLYQLFFFFPFVLRGKLLDLICPIMYLPAAEQENGNVNVFILMHVGVEVAAGSATLVAFWSALGKETRHSLLKMNEEDFMERLMYSHNLLTRDQGAVVAVEYDRKQFYGRLHHSASNSTVLVIL
ncbi:hypothetical protein Tco_0755428 [Tanacetum coccineum]